MSKDVNNVLMIAYHFPPCVGSSGLLRSFCFARDLPKFGWQPEILSARPLAYEQTSDELLDGIPSEVKVHRALAFDAQKHFSIAGRYPDSLALPDRFVSWLPFAVASGLFALWRGGARCIWSTYPIATSHLIGYTLARLSRRPWIADFRDPMVEYVAADDLWVPTDPRIRRLRLSIEQLAVTHAKALIFCTEGARAICLERYGDAVAERTHVVPNGYDEEIFSQLESSPASAERRPNAGLKLLHSGIIYPSEDRDPSHFIRAAVRLRQRGLLTPGEDRIVFRASGHDEWLQRLVEENDAADLIEIAGRYPYEKALREITAADGLLVFQGYTSNPAIPAKLYEYIRAGRPIFAMADAAGDTAGLLGKLGVPHLADLQSADDIETQLADFITRVRDGSLSGITHETALTFSRVNRAQELAAVLDGISA